MERNKNLGKIILGAAVILIGSILLLDNFNLTFFPLKQYIFSWKTLLIVIGAALLVSRKNRVGGIVLISLGIVFWVPALFNYQIALNQILLPSILIMVGLVFLLKIKKDNNHSTKKATELNTESEKTRVEIIE